MNVKQLIKLLEQQNQNLRVIVDGYEDGYNDMSKLLIKEINLNVNKQWYYGTHDDHNNRRKKKAVKALLIR